MRRLKLLLSLFIITIIGGATVAQTDYPYNPDTNPILSVSASADARQVPRAYPTDDQIITPTDANWPNFSFNEVAGVEWYRVWIGPADYSDVNLDRWFPATAASTGAQAGSGICAAGTCTLPSDVWLTNGRYRWWITTWSPTNPDFSNNWTQTTFRVNYPEIGPITRTPPATFQPQTLEWAYNPAVLWYAIWVGPADYSGSTIYVNGNGWYAARDLCDATTCTLDTSAVNFPPGDYEWWMQAWGPGDYDEWPVNGALAFTIIETIPATATDDALSVANGGNNSANILANDIGTPPLAVTQFAADAALTTPIPADGTSVLSILAGTGTLDITIDAAGNLNTDAATATGTGTVSIFYQMTADNGATNDIGQVDITYGDFPTATDDTLATLGAGNEYSTDFGVDLNVSAGTGTLNNDTLGNPAATLTLWGGGDASPSVNRDPGTSRPFAGGTLTVNADGSFDLNNPMTTGTFTFDYIIDNGIGTSQATVEIYVTQAPTAIGDSFTVVLGAVDTSNNVTTNDTLGAPPAVVDEYSDVGGANPQTPPNIYAIPGSGGITVIIDAGGNLTVDATTGTANTYFFDYQITNAAGSSVATVTVNIVEAPVAVDDTAATLAVGNRYNTLINTTFNSDGATFPHLMANDNLGAPAATLTQVNGTVIAVGTPIAVTNGTVTIDDINTGEFSFTPTAGFTGTATFTYTLDNGVATSTATVAVYVNEGPTAVDDNTPVGGQPAYVIAGAGPFTYPAGSLFADNGLGADALGTPNAAITSFGPTTGAETTAGGNGDTTLEAGILTVNADGSFSINPTVIGDHVFVYELENVDNNNNVVGTSTATVTIRLQLAPTAEDDTFDINFDDASPMISGDLNDANGGAADDLGNPPGTITQISGDFGTQTTPASVSFAGGTLNVAADGTMTLTNAGALTPGQYTFTYTLDNGLATDTATVTVNIFSPPIAVADAITVGLGNSTTQAAATGLRDANDVYTLPNVYDDATITAANDVDNSAALTIGTPYAILGTGGATISINADGSYTLDATGATTGGVFNFEYTLSNSYPNTSIAAITVTILTPPDGFDDSSTAVLNGTSSPSVPFHVALNAPSDVIGNLYADNGGFGADVLGSPSAPTDAPADVIDTITLGGAANPATGTIGGGSITFGGDGTINVATNGDLTFEPPTGFVGLVTFEYTLANSVGTDATPATVTIAVGERAVCDIDAYTGTANINFGVNAATGVLNNDTGGGGIILTAVMGNAANIGTATATTNGGTVTLNADGSFAYEPPAGTNGADADNFTYAISNGFGEVTTNCVANITLNTDGGAVPWFILRGAVGDNTGTFANPFNSLASFNAVNDNTGTNPGNGDVIYIYANAPGFYNEADGINLLDAQEVYGGTIQFDTVFTASGLVAPAYTTFAGTAEGSATEIRTTGDDAFDILSNNTIRGFTIGSTVGYAFADSGVSIGTTTISDVSTFNNGGVFNLQNGGSINATLGRMSASTNGSLSVIALDGIGGTITDTTSGGISHTGSGNMFYIRNGAVSITVSSPVTMFNSTGTGIFLSNADGTYTFSNTVNISNSSAGINIQNGSDGSLVADTITFITTGNGVTINGSNFDTNLGNTTIESVSTAIQITDVTGNVTANNTGNIDGDVNAIIATRMNGILAVSGTGGLVAGTGACANINGDTTTTTVNINVVTCSVTNANSHGINLTDVTGTDFTIQNATSITMSAGTVTPNNNTAEAIRLVNTSTLPIDISAGSTVTVTDRKETGLLGDNVGGTLAIGNYTDANAQGAGGSSIRIQNSSANVTFDQTNISNTTQSIARTIDTVTFIATNDNDDGQAIFLVDNTGDFTTNSGTISDIGNWAGGTPNNELERNQTAAAVDVRRASFSAPNGLSITPRVNATSDSAGPALRIENPRAGSTNTINDLQVRQANTLVQTIDIRATQSINGARINFSNLNMQNFNLSAGPVFAQAYRLIMFSGATGTLTNNITGTDATTTTGCYITENTQGFFFEGRDGLVDVNISNCRFGDPNAANAANNSLLVQSNQNGNIEIDILNNVWTNPVLVSGGANVIAIQLEAGRSFDPSMQTGGIMNARVANNNINSVAAGIRWRAGLNGEFVSSRAIIENNTINAGEDAMQITTNGGYTGSQGADVIVRNNIITSTGEQGIEVLAAEAGAGATGTTDIRLLFDTNTVTTGAGGSEAVLITSIGSFTIQANFTDNPLDAQSGDEDLLLRINGTGAICGDVIGNTFAAPTDFFETLLVSGTINIETGVGQQTPSVGPFTTVADGTCGDPVPGPYTTP